MSKWDLTGTVKVLVEVTQVAGRVTVTGGCDKVRLVEKTIFNTALQYQIRADPTSLYTVTWKTGALPTLFPSLSEHLHQCFHHYQMCARRF
jgi:hypothetical protein